ncbi:BTB/POZ and MATH domain-containing protein 1-like [Lolium rigidum]|uniref:BTB/POZ and MATH domain-containing protein 1-like n=1 Tax=Lolium rigidum TaxID=89674 RepID=UPI001F5C2DC1|nr:BTB/POZ and MATH domain-containing protein 1-like [Lolium rigidum]
MKAFEAVSTSTCTPDMDQVTHVFDIFGYSKYRGMGNDNSSHIRSGIFAVGGHDWAIRFYPDGSGKESKDYISVFLQLLGEAAQVLASCDLRLVDQHTGLSSSVHKTGPRIFNSDDSSIAFAPQHAQFKRRSEIENSRYLRDDRLTIECIVTVVKKPHVTQTRSFPKISIPQSDMADHVGRLLEGKDGFDLSLSVGGETFQGHRLVLAMRSPVFRAELYGPMREATTTGQRVTIQDMQPAVFRAMLHYIYTDSLPAKDLEGDDNTEMIRLLLVAADRYAMERLKLVCQSILCEDLNEDTVATTLALADQHSCDELKSACLQFIEISMPWTMDAVVASQGFQDLMATCPYLAVEALEKRRKSLDSHI